MSNLHFVFKSGEVVIYDEYVEFREDNKYFLFNLENQKFSFCLNDRIHFLKENDEEKFEIISKENETYGLVTLKKYDNATFKVIITDFEYKILGQKYIISYTVEGDEGVFKTIIFEFE